jgi:hypothetical protein
VTSGVLEWVGPGLGGWGDTLLRSAAAAVHAGNPLYAGAEVFGGSGRVDEALPGVLFRYALFHGSVAAATTAVAVARLRPAALREAGAAGRRRAGVRARGRRRPLGGSPMLWKELHHDSGPRLKWWGKALVYLLAVASLLPLVTIFGELTSPTTAHWLAWRMNAYIRGMGTLVACVALLGVAVRAAASVRAERDRDTFDALLTSPLTGEEILGAKWLGSIWGARRALLWLGPVWALGVVTGGLNPVAVPLLLAVWLVYAAALAGLGLYFSLVCRTAVRAMLATVGAAFGLGLGHWALTMCCLIGAHGRELDWLMKLQFGLTPPAVLGLAAFSLDDLLTGPGHEAGEMIFYCLCGVGCWAVLAWVLWQLTNERFLFLFRRAEAPAPWPGRPTGVPDLPDPR